MTAKKQEFFEDNCDGFEDADELEGSGRGHPLEWSDVHRRFLEMFEEELERFCEERGASERELAAAIDDVMDKRQAHLHDMLPVFLLTTEYAYFVRNMHDTAKMLKMKREANRSGGDRSLTGVYTYQPPPKKAHEAFLKARSVPWAIRKLVINATRKTEVVVTHDPGRTYRRPRRTLPSRPAEYPRRSRGAAATRRHGIVVAAAPPRPVSMESS